MEKQQRAWTDYRVRSRDETHHEVVDLRDGRIVEVHDKIWNAHLHVQDLSGWIFEKPYDLLQISLDEELELSRKLK